MPYIGNQPAQTNIPIANLDGVTATNTELNHVDGVTSNVQTQLNTKQPYATIAVTVVDSGGNKYALDGTVQQLALLAPSVTYRFDQSDSSNSGHPLLLSTTSDGTHGGGSSFTTGVTAVGTPGSAGAYTEVKLEQDAPDTLYYYCTNHSGMGGEIDVRATVSSLSDLSVTSTATELNLLDGAGTLKEVGKESIWIPAAAMYPSTTNPCSNLEQVETTALRPDLKCLDFAAAADDFAQFTIAFPKSWNEGTVTFQPFWTVTGTNTGTVAWGLAGIAASNDDSINTAFGTTVVTTALAHSGTSNDLMVSAESGAVTIAGSPAADDLCFFQVNRDVSADNQSGDARLLGIKLFFTTDAKNDA